MIPLTKRQQIVEFFKTHMGSEVGTDMLYREFGTSFRTRVSEINHDRTQVIRIQHRMIAKGHSVYWSELRA